MIKRFHGISYSFCKFEPSEFKDKYWLNSGTRYLMALFSHEPLSRKVIACFAASHIEHLYVSFPHELS